MIHYLTWALALYMTCSVVDTWVMVMSPRPPEEYTRFPLRRHVRFSVWEAMLAACLWALLITGRA